MLFQIFKKTGFEIWPCSCDFGTYLRAGRGSKPVWFRGPKTSPKVPVIYGATSGGPNPKLMMTLKKAPPLLKESHTPTEAIPRYWEFRSFPSQVESGTQKNSSKIVFWNFPTLSLHKWGDPAPTSAVVTYYVSFVYWNVPESLPRESPMLIGKK